LPDGSLRSPRRIENWYSYGKPVYAPGAGQVIATANDIPDNWFEDDQATQIGHPKLALGKDPNDIGNFVLIDHGNGEFSVLIHMKPGSIQVKAGEHVSAGQQGRRSHHQGLGPAGLFL
jgi:murein DD-endopeptidase MepM/ murein hydrolase activator NlpD